MSTGNLKASLRTIYSQTGPWDLIYYRILGYLIHHASTNQGLELKTVIGEIVSCAPECSKRPQLGEIPPYRPLVPTTQSEQLTIAILIDDTPLSPFERISDMSKAALVSVPQNYSEAKANALVQDIFRCVVTGRYDEQTVSRNRELEVETIVMHLYLP